MEQNDEPKKVYRRPKKGSKRNGKNRPSQRDKGLKYSRALKELNIHKPARSATARDVKTMTELKNMLRNTWSSLIDEVDNYKRFSMKQLEFYRRYAINGRKHKAKAMQAAGYQFSSVINAENRANVNLRLPYADDLIRAFEFEEKAKMGLMVEDVAKWFENIAKAAMQDGDYANANRAMESYAKYLGMFVDRKEVTHKVVQSKMELDARIEELQAIISENRDDITKNLKIN